MIVAADDDHQNADDLNTQPNSRPQRKEPIPSMK